MANIWHDIRPSRIAPEDFVAVIEIPKGSKKKYELDKETGLIKKLYLLPEHRDKTLEDQLLGQAISCLRTWGFGTMQVRREDVQPPEVLDRYGFRAEDGLWSLNIDPGIYTWEPASCAGVK